MAEGEEDPVGEIVEAHHRGAITIILQLAAAQTGAIGALLVIVTLKLRANLQMIGAQLLPLRLRARTLPLMTTGALQLQLQALLQHKRSTGALFLVAAVAAVPMLRTRPKRLRKKTIATDGTEFMLYHSITTRITD